MKRKLIKQGTGALTITLPKSWVSKYELKSGDEVEVDEQERILLLKLDGKSDTLRKTEINIDNFDQRTTITYKKTVPKDMLTDITDAIKDDFPDPTLQVASQSAEYDIQITTGQF